ncbi:MAG: pyridoxal 5'-phosphate synthase glutaminase subunit PdxT [Candidatus Ancillula sp.]|jgi:5'-phosphate synthase pdxT subunit|nr:pyridoxal 5'-phosphate synthase glutaminase subunit PdxT [Candidatus Ancillula sp.]
MKSVGVLALQGAFVEHENMLARLGVDSFEIRQREDLDSAIREHRLDGIVIPGGESTVIGKLLRELDLYDPLQSALQNGLPALGTCAGLIMLAKKVVSDRVSTADVLATGGEAEYFGVLDVEVKRNAFGRQLGSFATRSDFAGTDIPMVFIRAPFVAQCGPDVEVLARVDGKVVAVRQNNILATAFHPELTGDLTVHTAFVGMG